jgi:hypothetical protein
MRFPKMIIGNSSHSTRSSTCRFVEVSLVRDGFPLWRLAGYLPRDPRVLQRPVTRQCLPLLRGSVPPSLFRFSAQASAASRCRALPSKQTDRSRRPGDRSPAHRHKRASTGVGSMSALPASGGVTAQHQPSGPSPGGLARGYDCQPMRVVGGLTTQCSGRRARAVTPPLQRPRMPAAADRGRSPDMNKQRARS